MAEIGSDGLTRKERKELIKAEKNSSNGVPYAAVLGALLAGGAGAKYGSKLHNKGLDDLISKEKISELKTMFPKYSDKQLGELARFRLNRDIQAGKSLGSIATNENTARAALGIPAAAIGYGTGLQVDQKDMDGLITAAGLIGGGALGAKYGASKVPKQNEADTLLQTGAGAAGALGGGALGAYGGTQLAQGDGQSIGMQLGALGLGAAGAKMAGGKATEAADQARRYAKMGMGGLAGGLAGGTAGYLSGGMIHPYKDPYADPLGE